MSLSIEVRNLGSATIATFHGRIVQGDSAETFKRQLDQILEASNAVVINLGTVSYFDSHAIGILISAYSTAQGKGGRLKIVRPKSKRVQELLAVTKVHSVIPIYDSDELAVASLSSLG